MTSPTIAEIAKSRPHDAWLHMKLAELDVEISDISADRNRLIAELSKARTAINHLRAGLVNTPQE